MITEIKIVPTYDKGVEEIKDVYDWPLYRLPTRGEKIRLRDGMYIVEDVVHSVVGGEVKLYVSRSD